jgi:hypothetical protein
LAPFVVKIVSLAARKKLGMEICDWRGWHTVCTLLFVSGRKTNQTGSKKVFIFLLLLPDQNSKSSVLKVCTPVKIELCATYFLCM